MDGASPVAITLGCYRARARRLPRFGVELAGLLEASDDRDWLQRLLAQTDAREALFALVDREGLVVCLDVDTAHPSYRDVRGRSSRGRLSQGEYYHHDGCSSDAPPRIVEIRCPQQPQLRHTRTAIAPFPDTVIAMLSVLPASVRARDELADARALAREPGGGSLEAWNRAQGVITRLVRRELSAEHARAYFDAVDVEVGAWREPWRLGESRLIANHNAGRTMQHRRAYLEPPGARPNGHLVKRWPAELDAGPWCDDDDDGACARGG
ncbi:MAG: hypothetical protein U0168_06910 [Nannocystaceae bacterium]